MNLLGKIRLKKREKGFALFKRILVLMVCIITAMSMTMEACAAGNSVSAEFDIYEADTIINGLDGDASSSWYNLYNSFQKPLYYELTKYLLDNKVLTWSSNFWNAAFNDEFKNNPTYFYEVIIMGFLKYEQAQSADIINSKEKTLAITLYSELSSYYDDIAGQNKDDVAEKIKETSAVSGMADAVKAVDFACSTIKELVEAAAEYRALSEAKEERIAILKSARESVTDNAYFTSAVDDMIEKMEKTPISYVKDEALEDLWFDFLDSAWDLIVSDSSIGATLKAIRFEKQVLDVLFNSSDTASNNFKLLVVYIVDTYFYNAVKNAKTAFEGAHTEENARAFTACYRAYAEYQMYGLDYTKTFINSIVDSGPLHNVVEQIFFRESITDAEELSAYCDHQISSRSRCLELLDKLPSIFYKKNGLTEISQEVAYVPVTSISFKEPEVVLDHMDDIFLAYAEVTPSNATNKNVTYTSSDPSVLEVPEDGGFATLKKSGTVTITATAEDGGCTATQTVTVGEGKKLTSTNRGKCGEKLDWVLYSDGTLYINGTGKMYNWKFYTSPPWGAWGVSSRIKRVIIQEGVTTIGSVAFRNYNNHYKELKYVRLPNSLKGIGYDAFRDCYQIHRAGPVGGGFNIEFAGANAASFLGHFPYLSAVTIPDNSIRKKIESLTGIWSTEYSWDHIRAFTIYDKVSDINVQVLNRRYSLVENVYVTDESKKYVSDDGILYSVDKCNLLWYPCAKGKEQLQFKVPESVEKIGKGAFSYSILNSVDIPKSVIKIEDYAFINCKNIEKITLRGNAPKLGENVFSECNDDMVFYVPRGAQGYNIAPWTDFKVVYDESIGNITSYEEKDNNNYSVLEPNFQDKGTEAIYIIRRDGKTVSYAGTTNKATKSINIPSTVTIDNTTYKVTAIAANAFKNNKKLQTVTIQGNVTTIGASAFQGCTSLKTVKTGAKVKTIGSKAFYGCKKLSSLTLGKNVTSIGKSAFQSCTALKKVTIPSKVKKIGSKAFYNCKKLTKVTIKTKKLTAKAVGSKAFTKAGSGNYKKLKVKVPTSKYLAYKKLLKKKGLSSKSKITK